MNIEKPQVYETRKKCLGLDRHGRQYWWSCDRIIVSSYEQQLEPDEDNKVLYYSTRKQFEELLSLLDSERYEKRLVKNLQKFNEEICRGLDLIYQLTQHTMKSKFPTSNQDDSWIGKVVSNYYSEKKIELPKSFVTKVMTRSSNLNKLADSKYFEDSIYTWTCSSDHEEDKNNNQSLVLKRVHKTAIKLTDQSNFSFKLGMEAKDYVNLFNLNRLFSNKKQQQEERDYKRHLNQKFSIILSSALNEFKWLGHVIGPTPILINTIRKSILNLEANIHSAFLCPSWPINRGDWLTIVKSSNKIQELVLSLCILESSIKPVVFYSTWYESLGHFLLDRTSNSDREERKRVEKHDRKEQIDEIDTLIRLNPIKNRLQLDHLKNINGPYQLWKQKGEEYRMTGVNSWYWLSSTRVYHKSSNIKNVKVSSIDDLNDDEKIKVANTSTINVMHELRSTGSKRIYYPKHFDKKSSPKIEFLENLLEKRIKLKEALELEKIKYSKKNNESSADSLDSKEIDSKNLNTDFEMNEHKLNQEELNEIESEISTTFYCVKPVYLYNINENKEIQRNINTKRVTKAGQLPPFNRFTTKSNKKSIFVLPDAELRKLSRASGLKLVQGKH